MKFFSNIIDSSFFNRIKQFHQKSKKIRKPCFIKTRIRTRITIPRAVLIIHEQRDAQKVCSIPSLVLISTFWKHWHWRCWNATNSIKNLFTLRGLEINWIINRCHAFKTYNILDNNRKYILAHIKVNAHEILKQL